MFSTAAAEELTLRLLRLSAARGMPLEQRNGQRHYGPHPARAARPAPPRGAELYLAHLPRYCYEDELVPLFEKIAPIYEFRLMMDFSGTNRGFAFVCYETVEDAQRAIKELNGYEIRPNHRISVMKSKDNRRLYLGGLPRHLTRDQVYNCLMDHVEGVVDVILYPHYVNRNENRGFAFVELESHRLASLGRRTICSSRMPLLGSELKVEWADPELEVDKETMNKVKILYVRNMLYDTNPAYIQSKFEEAIGKKIERVKKINDYAFVHFFSRSDAEMALEKLQNAIFEGVQIEIKWAKPVDRLLYSYLREGRFRKNIDLAPIEMYQKYMEEYCDASSDNPKTSGYVGSGSLSPGSNSINSGSSAGLKGNFVDETRMAPGKLEAMCKRYKWPVPKYRNEAIFINGHKHFICHASLFIGPPLLPSITAMHPLHSVICLTEFDAMAHAAQVALDEIWRLKQSLQSVPVAYPVPQTTYMYPVPPVSTAGSYMSRPPPAFTVPRPQIWANGYWIPSIMYSFTRLPRKVQFFSESSVTVIAEVDEFPWYLVHPASCF